MLPTSHTAPRNLGNRENPGSYGNHGAALLDLASLPVYSEAAAPGACAGDELPREAVRLAGAFSEFIAAASRLEASYAELQAQVAVLGGELAERNAELSRSLSENERMRRAVEQMVDSMPCGVLVLGADGELSRINPEAARLLDLEAGSLDTEIPTLRSVSERVGIDLAAFVTAQAGPGRRAAKSTVTDDEQEFSLPVAGGARRWIEVRTRRLQTGLAGGGDERGWQQTILILRDVTAHKQAEQERERARRASALAEIAAMLAHEIRNPLASLELFAGLVAASDRLATGEGPELGWLGHMRAGIRSLAGTVNNVLSFHGGGGFAPRAAVDLRATVGSSVEFARPIADQAGVRLDFDPGAGRPVQVLASAGALQQLVLNLVSNAVRHTERGGSVRVSLRVPESTGSSRVRLECADTGSGIAPEHLAEIFRPGFSGSGNTSGLGLAVCREIVRQHGGVLDVSSSSPCGTTFFVELPSL